MTAPVPRTSDAVRVVIVAVMVFVIMTPVVWVFADGYDCAAQLLVVLYSRSKVFGNHHCVFLVPEQIYL